MRKVYLALRSDRGEEELTEVRREVRKVYLALRSDRGEEELTE